MQRTAAVLISTLIVLAGLWVVLVGGEGASSVPIMETDATTTSPGTVQGSAADPSGTDVTVRAYIDGEELDGSPDDSMNGDRNDFEFDIPRRNKGKMVRIVATNEDGAQTETWVPID